MSTYKLEKIQHISEAESETNELILSMKKNLAQRIEKEIKSNAMKQIDVAKKLGLRQSDISTVINGNVENRALSYLIKIAIALNIDFYVALEFT